MAEYFTKAATYKPDVQRLAPDKKFQKAFERIHVLLSDKKLCKGYLEAMEGKIVKRMKTPPEGAPSPYTAAQAMYDILRDAEIAHKFDADEVKYITGVITTAQKFYDLMAGKFAFLDPKVTTRHGAESHRLQWWIIMQDMKANSAEYGDVKLASDLYFYCSTKDPRNGDKGTDNLWYQSFDADQSKCDDFRGAENIKGYITKHASAYPNIVAAEKAQMATDTSIKMSSAKYKKVGSAVKARMPAHFELKEYP